MFWSRAFEFLRVHLWVSGLYVLPGRNYVTNAAPIYSPNMREFPSWTGVSIKNRKLSWLK